MGFGALSKLVQPKTHPTFKEIYLPIKRRIDDITSHRKVLNLVTAL
jgi:hypothetical protein